MQIIPSHNIDKIKWDACVANNKNGLIYASFDYLSAMSDNWSGLVINDYEAIMPLPWRKKWGIKYLYTPAFVQQLGLIGETTIAFADVLNCIIKQIKYGDYLLNSSNNPIESNGTFLPKCNFILDLSNNYQDIQGKYSKELIGYLKKAKGYELSISDTSISSAVDTYQTLYQERFSSFKELDYLNFKTLSLELEKKGGAFAKKVVDKQGNTVAIGLFLLDNKRIYNLMPSTLPEGRKLLAMHFLLDAIIREYSGKDLIFDFEGSDHIGIKKFYQLFGSIDEGYLHWHFNNLPFLIKAIKK